MSRKIIEEDKGSAENEAFTREFSPEDMMRFSERFAKLNRWVLKDPNGLTKRPTFYKYSKDQIANFLKNAASNQKQLRDAAIYLYNNSSHFRRLIQYFAGLTDLSYVVAPYRIDTAATDPAVMGKRYRKTLNLLSAMDIKTQFSNVVTVCLREDVFYGTMWVTNDNVTIQQLPSDYCDIAVVEGNVLNVTFDFSYFETNKEYLEMYPPEFERKYRVYEQDKINKRYQELDSPTSFAVKCNNDILAYAIPPFVGIFREIYDLEDYKSLKMTKTELENYAILVMKLGMIDGEWEMDLNKAKEFWRNLDKVLPEEVGSILSPMPIEKIDFDRSNTGDTDTISDAEQNLFTAAGVSTLLFNNDKASSNALLLSIKADQAITYGIVKSIEGVINRFIRSYSYGKNFRVTMLDCSPFNRKELGDQYLKAAQYGFPMLSYYCASQGLSQAEMDCMNYLEDTVLGLKERFIPLRSSATMSAETQDAGAPEKDMGDLSDSGEASRETGDGDDDML